MSKFHKFIYHNFGRPHRLKIEAGMINGLDGKTVFDVGYFDGRLKGLLRKDFGYSGLDPEPNEQIDDLPRVTLEDFTIKEKYDIVIASNILEHTTDPVFAIKKLKQLSAKYICIGVPCEPFFTMGRFFVPEEEHYWTIHPSVLRYYLGKPIKEKYFQCGRFYYAVYHA